MPYTITTRVRAPWTTHPVTAPLVTADRVAVATLKEARAEAKATCIEHERDGIGPGEWDVRYAPFEAECESIPESGGTIGPLPDGTIIEVRQD